MLFTDFVTLSVFVPDSVFNGMFLRMATCGGRLNPKLLRVCKQVPGGPGTSMERCQLPCPFRCSCIVHLHMKVESFTIYALSSCLHLTMSL